MTRSNEKHELLTRWLAKHRKKMLRVASHYAGGATEAEDIVQMASMIAWRRLESLRDGAKVGPWVLRITTSVGPGVAERRGRRVQLRANHLGRQPEPLDPFAHLSQDDSRRANVLSAAESLPSAQQEVVHCLLKGLSYKETAAKLDKTAEAVRVLRYRAVRSLRRILLPPPPGMADP